MDVISRNEAIEKYISLNLVKIATDKTGWNALYLDKTDNQFWLRSYANAEMHGGGQQKLRKVSEVVAKNLFGV